MTEPILRGAKKAKRKHEDNNTDYVGYQREEDYPMWFSPTRLLNGVYYLPENDLWNTLVCVTTLFSIVVVSTDLETREKVLSIPLSEAVDIAFNALYALHVVAHLLNDVYRYYHETKRFEVSHMWYPVDVATYLHYITRFLKKSDLDLQYIIKITCYYLRWHRPLRFLWAMNDYHLKGSIVGTLLKYSYIFMAMRVIYTNFLVWPQFIAYIPYEDPPYWLEKQRAAKFFHGIYIMDKLFLPLGTEYSASNDQQRIMMLIVMLSGSVLVTGIAVASLSLIIALYMSPEEIFRARFRLIMREMTETHVPLVIREKVETFYRMYWHKQKGVSQAKLLPTYPPTLYNTLYTDIYFEAQQRSLILRDLSYQFLSELSKCMRSINFIPGDVIIERNGRKFAIVYISYGDVEMLTADDDETPMLRFTRGSIMNPCGGCAEVAASKAHVSIRAATFCTAHVLTAADCWRVAAKFGRYNGQSYILHSSFREHFERVKIHYATRAHPPVKYKSTILNLKRNLMALKEAKDKNGKLLLSRNDVFLEIADCYIMRNHADASLVEESDSICLRSTFPCIMQPGSSLMLTWKVFVATITVACAYFHPFNMVFVKTKSIDFKFFDFMATLIFVLDIIIHLSTGANIEEGVPVTFTQTSSKQINSLWFVLDVIAVLPIFLLIGDGHFNGLNKLCKLPKVFRVLKSLEDVWVYQSSYIRLFSYCLLLMIITWIVACIQQGFWCFLFNRCRVTSTVEQPYWTVSQLDDGPVQSGVMYSIYWSLSLITFTSHKTPLITHGHWNIQMMIMLLFELCAAVHILVDSTYSATIMVVENMRVEYNACINRMTRFLKINHIDPVLSKRFIEYLRLCWHYDMAYSITHEKQSISFDLPLDVKQEISAIQLNRYIQCIPVMKLVNQDIIKNVAARVRLFYTSPNEILQNTGDISNEIYIIRRGKCQIIDPVTKKVVKLIGSRGYFGDIECLLRVPSYYTIKAATHVQIYSISRKHLTKIIAIQSVKEAVLFTKQQPEFEEVMRNRPEQSLRYEVPAPAPSREFFPLPRKHETDAAFLVPFTKLGFFQVLKYVFPRFTIRPDGPYLRRYEWFRAFCAFLSSMVFPIYYLLCIQFPIIYYISWLLDLSAYFDIVQRMLVGFFNEQGILVYHPASTSAHYMRGGLLLDLMASLPLEHLDSIQYKAFSSEEGYRIPQMMQFLMYNRILQLYRLPAALDILNDYIGREDIIYVIKVIPIFLALLLLVAELIAEHTVWKVLRHDGTWTLILKHNASFTNWVISNGNYVGYNITETPLNLILTCFYWATYELTTTGFDLFQPHRPEILNLLILGMFIAFVMTTYFTVRILSIRSNVNTELALFQDHLRDMTVYMQRENLARELQTEVVQYYEYTWDKTGGTDYRTLLKLCDQITLRTDAILHIYGPTFSKCPILVHCETTLLRFIGRAVKSQYFKKDMTIIDHSDVVSDMYFVDYGSVFAYNQEPDDGILLRRGSLFGNINHVKMAVYQNKFVANSDTHLLCINNEIFYRIIQEFPVVGARIAELSSENENYIAGSTRDVSFLSVASLMHLEIKESGLRSCLNPHRKHVQIYFIIVCMLCIYGDIYNAAFQDNSAAILGCLYALDVAFLPKFSAMLFDQQEERDDERTELYSAHRKRRAYFLGEFKYDLLSVLPIELFCIRSDQPMQALAFLRLNRIFRVVTVNSALYNYQRKLFTNLSCAVIISTLLWFMLFVHTVACVWYLLGQLEERNKKYSSWRYSNGTSLCGHQYLCSLYFVINTFTSNGISDILPRQQTEVLFVCVLMIMSTMMYMLYVGELSNIMQYQFFRCFGFYSSYLELLEFLKNNRVSENLVQMTKKYTIHLWRESRGLQEPHFLTTAPQCLRLNVMSAAYMDHLTSHPIFKTCESEFLRQLVGAFRPFIYLKNMYVVKEGEITSSLYFIHKGLVERECNETEGLYSVYGIKESFGLNEGLFPNVPYSHSYKTIIKSQVLTLSLQKWSYLLELYPRNKEIIYKDFDSPEFMRAATSQHDNIKKKVHISPYQRVVKRLHLTDSSTESPKQESSHTHLTKVTESIDITKPETDEDVKNQMEERLSSDMVKRFKEIDDKLDENRDVIELLSIKSENDYDEIEFVSPTNTESVVLDQTTSVAHFVDSKSSKENTPIKLKETTSLKPTDIQEDIIPDNDKMLKTDSKELNSTANTTKDFSKRLPSILSRSRLKSSVSLETLHPRSGQTMRNGDEVLSVLSNTDTLRDTKDKLNDNKHYSSSTTVTDGHLVSIQDMNTNELYKHLELEKTMGVFDEGMSVLLPPDERDVEEQDSVASIAYSITDASGRDSEEIEIKDVLHHKSFVERMKSNFKENNGKKDIQKKVSFVTENEQATKLFDDMKNEWYTQLDETSLRTESLTNVLAVEPDISSDQRKTSIDTTDATAIKTAINNKKAANQYSRPSTSSYSRQLLRNSKTGSLRQKSREDYLEKQLEEKKPPRLSQKRVKLSEKEDDVYEVGNVRTSRQTEERDVPFNVSSHGNIITRYSQTELMHIHSIEDVEDYRDKIETVEDGALRQIYQNSENDENRGISSLILDEIYSEEVQQQLDETLADSDLDTPEVSVESQTSTQRSPNIDPRTSSVGREGPSTSRKRHRRRRRRKKK